MNEPKPIPTPNAPAPDNHEEPSCMLSVRIPRVAKRRAKIAAIKSNLPFKHYVAQVLLHATPLEIAKKPKTSSTSKRLDRGGDPPLAPAATEPDQQAQYDRPVVDCDTAGPTSESVPEPVRDQ